MRKKIKLSKKELKVIREYQSTQNNMTLDLGQVDIQKAFLEGQTASILDGVADLQERSNKTA